MRVLNSYHQQRLWFIDYFEKNDLYVGGPVYHNIPFFLQIDKNFDRDLLKNAFLKLVENNAVLRTKLCKVGGEIFQKISETSLLNIDALVVKKENLIENAEELRQIPFDFDTDYLIKCYYENKQDHTIVYFVIHHALIDRQSIKLIENQFLALINNLEPADEKGIQFYNFSNWQNELSNEDLEPLLFHWKSKLKDLQVLYFSTDNEREQVHIYKANKISVSIDADKVKSFCLTKNISSRSLFLAAYKMAFARLTGLSDIVIGTWMDLRGDELHNVVGPIENLVVLRSFLDQQKTLLELCAIVDQEWQEAENFKAMPFDKLVLELNPKKDMSRTALFDILYVYESKAEYTNKVDDSVISNQGWGKYDFNLLVTEQSDKFDLVLTYNDLYFNQDTVDSLLDLVKRIVESVIESETSYLKDISLVSEKEYNKLVKSQDFTNDSSVSIVKLFSEQVKKHKQRTGVTWSSGKMNYEDLDVKSNQFANYLIDGFGIKTEDKIAIILPKSDSLIVSILGVLKAGAAYVPIDPSYPEDRKSFMIEDADCKLIVNAEFLNSFSELTEKLVQSLPVVAITGDNLAYIIYTSGTTGRPKGVMIEHGNVISLLNSCFLEFEFSEEDTWSFFHSYCFDFSIWEIFGALLTGGNVLVLSNEEVRNQELAAKLMADHNVTVFSQTPSAFYNFIALGYKVPSLRYVVFGGEALNPAKLKLWRESNADVRLINMYGITETTVHVTYKLLTDESLSSAMSNIGKPLAFANCYVLDQQQALLPYGRPGELYVSGQGVARGYLNRPEINAERFIPCPFDENEKMYRTGDLARFMPSGELEYLGRIDDQVKVRGYRIELDEIKKQIDSFQSVAQSAITLVLMPDGDKSIASYVTFKDNSTINDLKLHLSTKLPEYMIPAFIIQMDALPINANGKLDKTKLPSPLDNLANNGQDVVAPSNQIETDLFEIWKALLNTDEFGIKHNFFDLGGHSLKATRLISAIHKEFNVRLELKQIFVNPTLEQQALFIQSALKISFVEIAKIEENASYAISDAQRRLWVLSQFGDASLAYNMSSVMELDEIQDLESFKKAIYATVERHEILRTVFCLNENDLVNQKIVSFNEINFSVNEEDFSLDNNAKDLVSAYIKNDRLTSFNLENGPLLRTSIIKTDSNKYIFYYNMHHIISDGWSMNIIKRDILDYYQFYAHGKEISLPELRIQYKDYAAWQLEQFSKEPFIKAKEFWLNQLSGDLPLIDLPSQKRRPNIKTYSGRTLKTFIAKDQTAGLKKFVKDQDSTLFTGLLALWNILLSKYTNEKDIIIGSPVAGRDHIDLENQIGFFINTLVLRNEIDPNETFVTAYNKIKENTLKALENQIYPFDRLVDELNIAKDTSRNPVFDVMLILQNTGEKIQTEIIEDTNQVEEFEGTVSKFDLEILFQEIGDNLSFQIIYNSDVYESTVIKRILLSFKQILSEVLNNPTREIKNIDYLSFQERTQLLYDFNTTAVEYPRDKTLIDLFEEQVANTPNNIAVAFKDKELTYSEIDSLSSRLSYRLQKEYGIKKGDIVGVQLDRNEWTVISVLAILKVGAVYIPIDSELPNNRKAFIIEDTDLKLLITQPSFTKELDFYKGNILSIDTDFDLSDTILSVEKIDSDATDLAYIIYTSGSTGNPKGVMVEHSSLTNYLVWAKEYYLTTDLSNTNFGLFTSLSFDLTITSLFLPLISGGSLQIAEPNSSIADILQKYFDSEISCIKLTPAHISVLDSLGLKSNKIELAIVGGEELRKDHIAILKSINPAIRIINEYGPTETTVGCTVYEATSQDEVVLIGRPISNTSIYIVDEFNNLQAEGVTGEICIGGSGLARGYLNRADLTAEKFVSNPFLVGTRIYKTGDLGKWLPDGNLEYQGRVDDQVKILGHRIELGEIETRLLESNKNLKQAVVVVKGDAANKYLVAYYVSGNALDKKVIKDNVRKFLPDYMVPAYYVALESIPLSSNGKVDRKRLPEVSADDLIKEEYVAASSKEELLLVSIWSEVLKHNQISVKDNFYNLGGDSIKSIQVVSRLKQQGYTLKVEQLLRNPIIEDLAHLLELNTVVIDQSEVEGDVVLTPIQRDFFDNNDISDKNHYNQSVVLKSAAALDAVVLEKSILALINHHDALRMVYKQENELWHQYNANASGKHYKINFYDLQSDSKELELEALKSIGESLQSGFILDSGVLFNVGHFRMSDGDRLAFIVHHLVIDGISWRILLEDFSALYQSYLANGAVKLPLKTDSFQRWASLQENYAKSDKMQAERLYWEGVTNDAIPSLPTDKTPERKYSKIDQAQSFVLDSVTTDKLQTQVHQVYNTEINDILLTGLGLAIRDVFGVEKTVLKMEGHGREEIIDGVDIGRTIGWFTSVYPFVLDVSASKGYEVVVVKESLRKIPNKGIGYGILNYLDTPFTNELPSSIQFNYLGDFGKNPAGDKEDSLFEFSSENIGVSTSELNKQRGVLLDISGIMASGELRISIRYSADIFNEETIAKLVASYQNQLQDLIKVLSEIKEHHLTPSDLTYDKLTYAELSDLNAKNSIEDVYELSPLQQGLYYHWLVDDSSSMYFEQTSYRLHSKDLDIDIVQQAYKELINRYAVLRTSFTNNYGGMPLQIVHKSGTINFTSKHVTDNIETSLREIKEKDKAVAFDFEQPSLMRLQVLDLGSGDYEFIWSHHHILMDGWCISILLNDFYSILMALSNNQPINLPEPIKYSNYIKWLSKINKNVSLSYWKEYLKGIESVTEIPFRNKTALTSENIFKKKTLHIEGDSFLAIKKLCQKSGITLNTFTQGVWGYLLSRYNNTSDVVFGSVVSGRPAELSGVEHMVGLFINTIPVRVQYTKEDTAKSFLQKLQSETIASTSHHYLNLSQVNSQSDLGMELINHLMVFENYLIQESIGEEIKDLYNDTEDKITIAGVEVFEQSNYDFSIIVVPSASALKIEFTYNSDVFDLEQIEKLSNHFSNISEQFSTEQAALLLDIDYLSSTERNQLLYDFNSTAVDYPKDITMIDLFEEQVVRTPDNVAVVFEQISLTYKELNEQANQLGGYLRENYAIEPNDLVGIKLERSEFLIVSILGILKSGGAYVPIDPAYPKDRIAYIEKDSNSKLIIDEAELELFHNQGKQYSKSNIEKISTPNDLAYVIYTSGSTGNPKGVMIEHKNVVNFLYGMTESITLNQDDKLLAITSISFDISILELFWTLINGVAIKINKTNAISDFDRFVESKSKELDFSIFYFSNDNGNEQNKYGLIKETVQYADENGYSAVWFPERHFHEFGGIFPNPSILAASFANSTKKIEIRSGSVVLPLHDVVRVAEEWSVIDNLSGGRIALSVTAGWHPDDFIFMPENYQERNKIMYNQIEELKKIWKGDTFKRKNGLNHEIELKIYPKPINPDLKIYITTGGNPESFRSAGKIGANILTHLLGQEINELKRNIVIYKNALIENGYSVRDAKISLMVHTFIGDDIDETEKIVREPFKEYLKSNASLAKNLVRDLDKDLLDTQDMEAIMDMAFERYWKTSALLGTQESCMGLLNDLYNIGVTEIACLIDFGINKKIIVENLKNLTKLKSYFVRNDYEKEQSSFTSIQITPSYLEALLDDTNSQQFIKSLKNIIVGGENFTNDLLNKIRLKSDAAIYNMYGPTETTIWSTFQKANRNTKLNIGKPIHNTQIYILDSNKLLCPIGVVGDLYIGGDGLSRGYYNQQELTNEKFITLGFDGKNKRLYRTGDLAKWLPNGTLDFLGRNDSQVKLNGFRIELGEIEQLISNQDLISQAVVVIKEKGNEKVMVAYFVSNIDIDKKTLQSNLSKFLPDYMIPRYYIQLDSIPLTPNGKVDRKSLPNIDEKDLIKDQYIAPRTNEEKILVSVWSEVLKYEQISVKDSFYNLGGDSIKTIRIVSLLKQRGYTLKVEQVLRNPVVEDLAKLLECNNIIINQSEVKGEVVLTPIQHYFFENLNIPNKNYYNQSIILKSKESIESLYLQRSISALVLHHDALRMVYKFENNLWSQYNADTLDTHYSIDFHDLQKEFDELEALNRISNKLQAQLDISSGILFKIGHFRMSDGDRLVLIVHHLVVDNLSWQILLDDLSSLYKSFKSGNKTELLLKTDSFQYCAKMQKEFSESKEMQAERLYWKEVFNESIPLFPVSHNALEEESKIDEIVSFVLDENITYKLKTEVNHIYNTNINDILLTCLGVAIREVFGVDKSIIKIERDGREGFIEGINTERTIGWFTNFYPFLLDVKEIVDAKDALIHVKENLRKVPQNGMGYGISKYFMNDFDMQINPTITFNYLRDFETEIDKDSQSIFEYSLNNIGLNTNGQNGSDTLLNISGMTISDQLAISIGYSKLLSPDTIKSLATVFKQKIQQIAEILASENISYLTPSDLTFNALTISELSSLNLNNNIEDVYELSPLQQGLYYHWLLDNSSPMYFTQMSYELCVKKIKISDVKQAYDQLVQRYSVLRTSFTNDLADVSLQIVHRNVSSNFIYERVPSHLNNYERKKHVDCIKLKDRMIGFNLKNPSQIRLKILDYGEGHYEFIWSYHHIIIDGWCLNILVNEFFTGLQAIQNNKMPKLPVPNLFSSYIKWLKKIDKGESLKYWRGYLSEYTKEAEIPFRIATSKEQGFQRCSEKLVLGGKLYSDISTLCNKINITQNTFIQTIWGFLLSKYNDTNDVVFGAVVSGRSANFPGIEDMIGLFINTIPVRISYDLNDTPINLFVNIQKQALAGNDHHFGNLGEIQAQSVVGTGLINHIMVFQNASVQNFSSGTEELEKDEVEKEFILNGFDLYRESNYDFEIAVVPFSDSIMLEFQYNGNSYASSSMSLLMNQLKEIAKRFSSNYTDSLKSIDTDFRNESSQKLKSQNRLKLSQKIKR